MIDAAKADKRFSITVTLVFLVLAFFGICRHEMWRDELQVWLLVSDATSLTEVYENCRYEGHPVLWHALVWAAGKIWNDPFVMQVLHVLIGTLSVWLFAAFSPFNKLQKTGFVFGYYMLYEYTIISRCYGLGILLTFIFCTVHVKQQQRLWLWAIAGLLANTSVAGLMISAALFLFLIAQAFRNKAGLKQLLPGGLIYLLPAGFSLLQIWPEPDNTSYINNPDGIIPWLPVVLANTIDGFTGLLSMRTFPQWNLYGCNELPVFEQILFGGAGIFIIAVSAAAFLPERHVLVYFLAGVVFLVTLSVISLRLQPRQSGYYLLMLVSALWLNGGFGKHKFYSYMVSVLFSIQLIPGIAYYGADLVRPFSRSSNAAEYLRSKFFTGMPLIAAVDYVGSPLSAWLGRPVFYSQRMEYGTFIRWDTVRKYPFSSANLDASADKALNGESGDVMLVLSKPVEQLSIDSLSPAQKQRLKFVHKFEAGMVADEQYYLYLFRHKKH